MDMSSRVAGEECGGVGGEETEILYKNFLIIEKLCLFLYLYLMLQPEADYGFS